MGDKVFDMQKAYRDPNSPQNGSEYHTGKDCVEDCNSPAGTAWSPYWCFECNVIRMDRIGKQLEEMGDKKHWE